MVASVGRMVTIKAGAPPGTPIASCRTKTVSINNEPVDITSDDDNGYRTLLDAEVAQSSIDIQVEGVLKDGSVLLEPSIERQNLEFDLVVDFGSTVFNGTFKLISVEIGAAYNDAVTFQGQFQSTGAYGMGS